MQHIETQMVKVVANICTNPIKMLKVLANISTNPSKHLQTSAQTLEKRAKDAEMLPLLKDSFAYHQISGIRAS